MPVGSRPWRSTAASSNIQHICIPKCKCMCSMRIYIAGVRVKRTHSVKGTDSAFRGSSANTYTAHCHDAGAVYVNTDSRWGPTCIDTPRFFFIFRPIYWFSLLCITPWAGKFNLSAEHTKRNAEYTLAGHRTSRLASTFLSYCITPSYHRKKRNESGNCKASPE